MVAPKEIRPTMHHNRMQTGITGQDLPRAAGGGITLHNILYIFAKAAKHRSEIAWSKKRNSFRRASYLVQRFYAEWQYELSGLKNEQKFNVF